MRIVHLGLGAFSRSHQAWYTAHAADASEWGIAAYAGRSRDLADRLTAQDGLYTLVERGPECDRFEVIGSVVRTHAGDDLDSLLRDLVAPDIAVVTLTITETGYASTPDGSPDLDHFGMARDLDVLRALGSDAAVASLARPVTALGRLALGLELRRRANGPALALVSCDNLPDNGDRLRRGIEGLAAAAFPALPSWLAANVSFVSTSVDRITPRVEPGDIAEIAIETGWLDEAPVIAEPFSDWVLSGEFPAGRPAWETAGATFVADLEPYELRKLWMLNGAHTLLACMGLLRGHVTVAEAIADPDCRTAVERLWDEDVRNLPGELGLDHYRAALLERFSNSRIEHRLEQIATDSLAKLRVRVATVAEHELAAGRTAEGCATVFTAWVAALAAGFCRTDAAEREITDALESTDPTAVLLALVSTTLAADAAFAARVASGLERIPVAANVAAR
ncbi:MAG TPA: mannitol dehydrogenase family protein [Agromyces sp.]|nr:mannitol dehydrogenase family protein [Agromyces sp.]